jgi:hypothetical protein
MGTVSSIPCSFSNCIQLFAFHIVNNTLRLVLTPLRDSGIAEADSGSDQIIDLIKRSETLALQSEGTRVLVNVVRSLWSPASNSGTVNGAQATQKNRRREAIEKIVSLDVTEPLAEMLGRSAKYPILLNEAVVALTLLSNHPTGGKLLQLS